MTRQRERIFNLPGVIMAVIAILTLFQLLIESLPEDFVYRLMERFALLPVRLTYLVAPNWTLRALAETADRDDVAATLTLLLDDPGGAWYTPLSYALLHGNWTHLAVNALSLAAFGSPVAKRLGTGRFLAFLALGAVAGALAHTLFHALEAAPVIGASAAVSGTMAAVARFAFAPGAPLGERRAWATGGAHDRPPAEPLASLGSNRRALFFLAVWFGVNLLFGVFPEASGAASAVAWEAHMGGFLAGLLLFGFFDPRPARTMDEAGGGSA